jgi:sulfur carrier protein ThiS adenylyltransferase
MELERAETGGGEGVRNGRYSRQELFARIGPDGQRLLRAKHAFVLGAGALGTGNAELLVRAGVGKLTIVDRDYVEWSNLQRQQLYEEADARERLPKAIAAQRRLQRLNGDVEVRGVVADAGLAELEELAADADVLIDAADNFDARLLLNDFAVRRRLPWVYGACVGSYGTALAIVPGETPCLRCLLETVPLGGATCDTAGIIAPAVHMVVAYQGAEALKLLTGDTAALHRKLVSFDLWTNQHTAIDVSRMKRPDCPTCGERPTYPHLQPEQQTRTAVLCGRDTVQLRPPAGAGQRDLRELARSLQRRGGDVQANAFLVSFAAGPYRLVVFADGRVLVHGTKDVSEARAVAHKYLG